MIYCYIYKTGEHEPVKKHYQTGKYMTQAIYRIRETHPETLAAGNNWFCVKADPKKEKEFSDILKYMYFN